VPYKDGRVIVKREYITVPRKRGSPDLTRMVSLVLSLVRVR
jgi:hypothetical protein